MALDNQQWLVCHKTKPNHNNLLLGSTCLKDWRNKIFLIFISATDQTKIPMQIIWNKKGFMTKKLLLQIMSEIMTGLHLRNSQYNYRDANLST